MLGSLSHVVIFAPVNQRTAWNELDLGHFRNSACSQPDHRCAEHLHGLEVCPF
jgi:hypothetical protein